MPTGIVGAHDLVDLGRARLADADEVVLDGVEIPERLGLLGEGHEVPPQSDEKTASGFLAIWALMNGV